MELLLNKFRYAIPVNRSINRLEDVELSLPVGTITDGFAGMLPLFEELYETIKEHNLSATLWGGDETGYKVFVPVEGKVGNRSTMGLSQPSGSGLPTEVKPLC